ncbi:CDP-glycerol glycerophosphotransferase family protein [Bacillus paramycoides]|uniref:CDP-glycerol glycerophosphotransferase family protein n=1 Tax=Bacillus paramycoides TaxID=2026194 RepID=UPI002E227A3E|nr:CDP-glycerol glycerophosphotransferase family protein [Bacillus paramycoides]
MNFFSFLWEHKEKVVCSLSSITCDNKFNIKMRLDFNDEATYTAKLILIHRETKKELAYPLKQERSSNALDLTGDININNLFKAISYGIWDAYLLLESGQSKKKYRIRNSTTEFPELIGFNGDAIHPYATVKENLSFKCEVADGVSKIETCHFDEEGQLCLEGYAFVPGLDIISNAHTKKQIVIRTEEDNKEYYFPCQNITKKDVTQKYGILKQNYNGSGFSISIDLLGDSKSIENQAFKIFIDLEFKTNKDGIVKKLIPIKGDNEIINHPGNGEFFKTDKGVKTLSLKSEAQSNDLLMYINNFDVHAEAKVIYAENDRIDIHGNIVFNENNCSSLDGKHSLMIKKRFVGVDVHLPIEIKNSKFICSINLKKMALEDELREGIWDLYVRINHKNYRLATRLDGINDKQKCIVFPQQLVTNSINKALTIKPYYTLHDEVSILIRNYIFYKNIQDVFISPKEMKLIGKISIMRPNDEVPEHAKGRIRIKGPDGNVYELPLLWTLRKTEKNLVEFDFEAVSDPTYKHLPQVYKEIAKNIRFDSIECEVEFEGYISKFALNVNPEKVHVDTTGHSNGKSFMKNLIEKNKETFYRVLNKVLPVNKKTVVFQSYYGNSYACNPKAIYEEMLNQNRDMKAVWIIKNLETEILGNPIKVQPYSIKYYYYMAIAKYFVNNGNFPDFYEKRSGTIHLQTWHGTPLKRLGLDIDPSSPAYAENTSPELIRRNERWDYLIGPNTYTSKILQRAYNFKKNVLEVGYPRNDMFYSQNNKERINEIKKLLNISPDKKVILYAPTWRDYEKRHEPYAFRFDLDKFQQEFGNEYVLLLRLHYFDAARMHITGYEKFVYNVTYYNDIQDLYLISDVLITDYSSVMFDYANLNRPMIFFTYDLLRYGSQIRGFYIDFKKEAPGPLVQNENQLFKALHQIDTVQKKYESKYQKFREKFCHLEDGKASKRTIDTVFEEIS